MATDVLFSTVKAKAKLAFRNNSIKVHPKRWQGKDVSASPDMTSYELLNFAFTLALPRTDLDHYRRTIEPNLPWADDHFEERVCGWPLNPGKQWQNWPWANSADKFRTEGMFNHTYSERLWPKYARFMGATQTAIDWSSFFEKRAQLGGRFSETTHRGIAWNYGDLHDLVTLLASEPETRQAVIPLFFPEDTGIGDGDRKPCTLLYNFIMRQKKLHLFYPIRSCDYVRHFPDDVYLAVRLLLWVIEQCKAQSDEWRTVKPGTLTMHCTSLHIFLNDWIKMFGSHMQ
jgi:thymidylate synthase